MVLENGGVVKRGDVISKINDQVTLEAKIKCTVYWMAETPLVIGRSINIRCATQEVQACAIKIENKLDTSTLKPLDKDVNMLSQNQSGRIIFNTEKPIVIDQTGNVAELGRITIEKENKLLGLGII